jgi:hypothetical protein
MYEPRAFGHWVRRARSTALWGDGELVLRGLWLLVLAALGPSEVGRCAPGPGLLFVVGPALMQRPSGPPAHPAEISPNVAGMGTAGRAIRDASEVRWDFETGSLRLRFTGYELKRFESGGLRDWLSGSAELRLTFHADEPGEGEPPAAQLRASTDELSIASDELKQLHSDLAALLDGRSDDLNFTPFERDVQLTVGQANGEPTIAVVVRSGVAVTTLDPQPTTREALRRAQEDVARVAARFPPRG